MTSELHQQAKNYLRQALAEHRAEFREHQWEAIELLIRKRGRLLLVERTGWGKSVVYFLVTRLLRLQGAGPTLLISPLLALMRNQILMAQGLEVNAATINSSNQDQWEGVQAGILADKVDILLISPERLANDEFREQVLLPLARRVGLLVIDEAHCISDWGHDFRPDYRRMVRILQALPSNIPVLATTATANDRVVDDIREQLGHNLQILRGPLARSSLCLQNIYLPTKAARMAWLAEHLPGLPGTGIIYTLTIRDAQLLAAWLQSQDIMANSYWGGLDPEERLRLEHQLLQNEIKALVATSALGMGFDKPDLGFVIHFQRPGSVIHYYQQVGRAGRAVDRAYGILLSGDEDQDITQYFIQTAFPPEADAALILDVLNQAEEGLSLRMLQRQVNLPYLRLEKIMKQLAVLTPSPVVKRRSRWYRSPVPYVRDQQRIDQLTALRLAEQTQMSEYLSSQECLMAFLQKALDDPQATACGRCAPCVGKPLRSASFSTEKAQQAVQFLRRTEQVIAPRRQWPLDAMAALGWTGYIPWAWRAEPGRALCRWGDAGWGELVRLGKQQEGRFDQKLLEAAAEMVKTRWRPEPFPTWVTYVPSLRTPKLVLDFAQRLANKIGLPFVPCIKKIRETEPQKLMRNSYQQARNLVNAFQVESWEGIAGPVLLVDDIVDSRWTFTVMSALLKSAGSGPVFPLALAMATPGGDE